MDWSYLTLCILNAHFSYTATILNIVTIYAIMKTSSLSKNFKTLLLSLAVSDLGVGLLAQPMFAAHIMDSKQNNETMNNNAIYISHFVPRLISSFLRHCLVSRLSVQTDIWQFTFTSDIRNLWLTSVLLLPWPQFGYSARLLHCSAFGFQEICWYIMQSEIFLVL